MGIFDFLKLQSANPKEPLVPVNTLSNAASGLYGRGNGNLLAMLSKALPNSTKNWVREAGDLSLSSIVAISVRYYLTNFQQISFQLIQMQNGQRVVIEDSDIIELLSDPMSGKIAPSQIWGNFIQDYLLMGNAYLRKIRGVGNQVIALEYVSSDMIRAEGTPKISITRYVYTTSGQEYAIPVEDIIHLRYAKDTSDARYGRSPITSLLREIALDNMCSTTSYALVRNQGIPSLMIGPDANDVSVDISPDDARQLKRKLSEDWTGDSAGGVAIMSSGYRVDRISFSPEELNLSQLRRVSEERIPAALGLNAMVLGLGAGLERSTYSNYQAAQQASWETGIIPLLDAMCEILTYQLLVDFSPKPGYKISYDLSNIKALSEDKFKESERSANLYKTGVISRAEAKLMIGITPESGDEDIYFNSVQTISTPTANKNYNIKFIPTEEMVRNAERALRWKEEGYDGGTRVGLARANQIVNREKLSEDTILRMYSFFSRHEVDKEAEGFNQGEEGFPSPGRVAWELWSGDAGFAWATRIRNRMMDDGKSISVPLEVSDEDYNAYQ
jgi:HK97 family phage portal protein